MGCGAIDFDRDLVYAEQKLPFMAPASFAGVAPPAAPPARRTSSGG